MTDRKFTKRTRSGMRTKSTLLTGLERMKNIRKTATTKQKLRGQHDYDDALNSMLTWLKAVRNCPPRHYGKVWNDEKELIVRQCEGLYTEMQKFAQYHSHAYMGNNSNLKRTDDGNSDRFIHISRIRWNPATLHWDYSNQNKFGSDPYWRPQPVKECRILKDNKKSWALYDLSVQLMSKEQDTEDAMEKIVTPYSEWTPGLPRWT